MKLPAVEIKSNQCKGCGLCIDSCKPGVLSLSKAFNLLGYQYAEYKQSGCTGCEACYYACPEPGAISIHKEKKVQVQR
ncbi:MAG: 4Fe-4S dicluster domain-containing protein [Oligoflexia bacterium]|nr:4Fe-4S dicluster domain-containing protein [Oligoflexia bacterium]